MNPPTSAPSAPAWLPAGPALLFAPADRPDRFAKAAERSDVVIVDLEDGAALDGHEAARRNIAISLLPEDRSGPVARWKLFNAFPVRFTLGPLNAKGTDVAMEELVLAAERLEIA